MTSSSLLTPLSSLRISTHYIPRHRLLPNTSIVNKPLLIYHSVFQPTASPSQIEQHITSIGEFIPQWRYGMYHITHFHSTTHELLVIASGSAKLCFGGENNPERLEADVKKGDAILVPAGVAHRALEEDGSFEMVGSYPVGASKWDMCYGKEGEDVEGKIRALSWVKKDPLYGEDGPAMHI
ncbi:hypothetical protein K474DRAFT_1669137 [Panus rudis PR-1116 ss-1]|nr:hypothetical protein K474DRAFT_1669137 [Panus rudis PR-1116 ss-1]